MRRIVLLLIVIIVLTACKSAVRGLEEYLPIAEFGDELIDENNPLNEQQLFEHVIEKQEDFFIPDIDALTLRNPSVSIFYSPERLYDDETFSYSMIFETSRRLDFSMSDKDPTADMSGDHSIKHLTDTVEIDHPELSGAHGVHRDFSRYFLEGFDDNIFYTISTMTEAKPKDENTFAEIVTLMKKGKEIEVNPFRDYLTLDLENVKFPKLNDDYFEIYNISLHHAGKNNNYDRLNVGYNFDLDSDSLSFDVSNKEDPGLKSAISIYEAVMDNGSRKKKKEYNDFYSETPAGIKVIKDKRKDNTSEFYWDDGEYYYHMNFHGVNKSYNDKDIFKIIDSTFSSK